MSYYNDVIVIFCDGSLEKESLDFRSAGQILPTGSIPIAVANPYRGLIMEIINEFPKEVIREFIEKIYTVEDSHNDGVSTLKSSPYVGLAYISS